MTGPSPHRNDFLDALAPDDLDALRPDLEPVDLPVRRSMATANRPIRHVYFLDSGISSTTANLRHEVPVEIGLAGWDGVANLPALLGVDRTPADVFMQVAGAGHRIAVERVREIMAERPAITRMAMLWSHFALLQVASTALVNCRGDVTERLARWLLMTHDRVDGDLLPLTHEFLAMMLGVRRPGVTTALRDLEQQGLVARGRGHIEILDRAGVVETANGFYGASEAEVRRLRKILSDAG